MNGEDSALGFTVAARNARGRIVRLGPLLETVLASHAYPPVIERLLAEALVLTALLGTLLKGEGGQLTMQAQTEGGPVRLLVCDYRDGELRGYVDHDSEAVAMVPASPSLFALFGKGYLAITFDQETSGERYQGIVPLEGASLASAVQSYFGQSEQVPSLIRVGIDPGARIAGGLLVQHYPEGEVGRERLHVRDDHPDWDHVRARGETMGAVELADPSLALDTLIWRLFHDDGEIRVMGETALTKGCRCDRAHICSVLARFAPGERAEMADSQGLITVDCAFCAKGFPIALDELVG